MPQTPPPEETTSTSTLPPPPPSNSTVGEYLRPNHPPSWGGGTLLERLLFKGAGHMKRGSGISRCSVASLLHAAKPHSATSRPRASPIKMKAQPPQERGQPPQERGQPPQPQQPG
jgi:hypothetical protein